MAKQQKIEKQEEREFSAIEKQEREKFARLHGGKFPEEIEAEDQYRKSNRFHSTLNQPNLIALNSTDSTEQGSISSFFYRPHVLRYLPTAWNHLQNGRRVGLIVGSDKPYVGVINNRWMTKFHDPLVEIGRAHV